MRKKWGEYMKEKARGSMKEIAKLYLKRFNESVVPGMWIKTQDGSKVISINLQDEWKQCYPTERGAKKLYSYKARKQLPPYWFINNQGDVITLESGKPYLLKPDDKGDEVKKYKAYHIGHSNIQVHALVGLVFSSKTYGKAAELIKKYGIKALGRERGKVHAHHQDGNKENNQPDNIIFAVTEVHCAVHNISQNSMQKFSDIAAIAEPDHMTMVLEGTKNQRQLVRTKKLLATERAAESLENVSNSIITLMLANDLGVEYFTEPKTVFIDSANKFVTMVSSSEGEVETTEIEPSSDIKINIVCRLNKHMVEYAVQ